MAGARRSDLRVVTVFLFLFGFFLFFYIAFSDRLQFERTGGDHLEVGAALGAGDDFALVYLIFLDVEIGVALGTQKHTGPPFAY